MNTFHALADTGTQDPQWRTLDNFTSDLRRDARFSQDYIFLTVAAAIIATLGLRANSVATVVGA